MKAPKYMLIAGRDFLALEYNGLRRLWPDKAKPKG